MVDDDRSRFRIELAVIIPTVTAIIAGLLGFLTSSYVSYLNNQGTLQVEQQKEKAEGEQDLQKRKANLILEAVKVGDKQKAADNLLFFIDAGLLDDPDGRIKSLLKKSVSPVLPGPKDVSGQTVSPVIGDIDAVAQRVASVVATTADESLRRGEFFDAIVLFQNALNLAESVNCDGELAKSIRQKLTHPAFNPPSIKKADPKPCVSHGILPPK